MTEIDYLIQIDATLQYVMCALFVLVGIAIAKEFNFWKW